MSCCFPKTRKWTEVSSSFQPHFPDSNLISISVFKKQHKKGPRVYKNNQGQTALWAKAWVEKRDPCVSSIWCPYCWKRGSAAVGRRLSNPSWEQRKDCVAALIKKCGKFHSCLYRLAGTLWFDAATSCMVFWKHSYENTPVEAKRTLLSCVPVVSLPSSDSTVMHAHFWEVETYLFLFQGAALIYHKIWIIWYQHLLEVQDKI